MAVVSFVLNGRSRLVLACVCPFAFGVGFGRSVCAAVSFHLILGSAARVGRPARDLAEKWEVCVVSLPRLNISPRIPAVKSGRPAGTLESVDLKGPNRHPLVIRTPLKAALIV